ncbi:MAG: YajQ family cyclic di-GMP-binding protein [Gammaproteobacteria bacterium]|nr:MAG: YajQ family cyclic di-GMP-binding protein [Gammaproteobacteria bacterium]
MPSFDVVSEVDKHELTNAVDQTNREISNRFDFKGIEAKLEQSDEDVILKADAEFRISQMRDIFHNKLVKRGIDIKSLAEGDIEESLSEARQKITVKQGIDKDIAKKIVKQIKNSKMKVQAAIQGEQIRVTGKKRDDLQAVMRLLEEGDIDLPLQFTNFRD